MLCCKEFLQLILPEEIKIFRKQTFQMTLSAEIITNNRSKASVRALRAWKKCLWYVKNFDILIMIFSLSKK